jgi:tetratricopeptide (TPR) repeat protein
VGRYDEAEAAFREAIRLDPRSTHFANLARFLAIRGRDDESAAAFRIALSGTADHADHHALRGEMLIQALHNPAAAREEFRQALSLEPRLLNARQGLEAAERMLRRAAATMPASAPASPTPPAPP